MHNSKIVIITFCFINFCRTECPDDFIFLGVLPNSITILSGDSCFYENDIAVLDSIITINDLDYESPMDLGTQTWYDGRLRFLIAGNYGNNTGVNSAIYRLPENLGDLAQLASLRLEWNRISELPSSFTDLNSLFTCYLNNNLLASIPDSIGNLSNLNILDLGYNEISMIPESICNLENLSYLWLFNNKIKTLPNCFCNMNLDLDNTDDAGYPFFAIGSNNLCDNIPFCLANTPHLELSLDQFYYSFPVFSPQVCDSLTNSEEKHPLSNNFAVSNIFPNPFNPISSFELSIAEQKKLDIKVFNILGEEVDIIKKQKIFDIGNYKIVWDAKYHPSGIYYLVISDKINVIKRKMILIK
tara:strand:- start:1866 stop:2933 length:1068 start_codon:yes stop_codon:yes gene_type:complete